MSDYGNPDYWDQRYQKQFEMMFDWLETYDTIKPFIEDAIIGKNAKVLILGCGNAEFSENMYDAGYHDIENIDISSVVIDQMSDRNWNRPEMQYKIMDVRDLQYPDNYFDMVIDKSTIDALLCGKNSFVNVAKMMKEVQRVLKVGGIYLVITYGEPETRIAHFQRDHLNLDLQIDHIGDIENPNDVHYVYTMRKRPEAETQIEQNYESVLKLLAEEDRRYN